MGTVREPDFGRRQMESLVKGQIERLDIVRRGFRFDEQAIHALVQPSLSHLEEVREALQRGTISREFLGNSIHTLLANACNIASERGDVTTISAEIIKAAMKKHCPYVFWC